MLSMAAFQLQEQSCVIVTATFWPTKPKTFTTWVFTESLQTFALGSIPKLEVLKWRICTFSTTLLFQDGPANMPIYIPIASA